MRGCPGHRTPPPPHGLPSRARVRPGAVASSANTKRVRGPRLTEQKSRSHLSGTPTCLRNTDVRRLPPLVSAARSICTKGRSCGRRPAIHPALPAI
eukprot:9389928-Alexandrium_andersonii.AAC.1